MLGGLAVDSDPGPRTTDALIEPNRLFFYIHVLILDYRLPFLFTIDK